MLGLKQFYFFNVFISAKSTFARRYFKKNGLALTKLGRKRKYVRQMTHIGIKIKWLQA
jgi:hypothetical protein